MTTGYTSTDLYNWDFNGVAANFSGYAAPGVRAGQESDHWQVRSVVQGWLFLSGGGVRLLAWAVRPEERLLQAARAAEWARRWRFARFKNCHTEASRHLGGRGIDFTSTSSTFLV